MFDGIAEHEVVKQSWRKLLFFFLFFFLFCFVLFL